MKFILISLFLMLLAITCNVFGNPTISNDYNIVNDNQTDTNPLIIVDIDSIEDVSQEEKRFRRACDCKTTTGRCVPYGNYQCFFNSGSSIVQCVGGNKWVTISRCPSSCRLFANDQPYCT